jgi:hypothetical protein
MQVFDEQAEAGGRVAEAMSGRAPANRATHCPRTTGDGPRSSAGLRIVPVP